MNEFEFTAGSLEAQGLQEGDEVECTYSPVHDFVPYKTYPVISNGLCLCLESYYGAIQSSEDGVMFKPVSMNEFEFTAGSLATQGLQEGDEVECTYSDNPYITVGKKYTVYYNYGSRHIDDDDGDPCYGFTNTKVTLKPISVNVQQKPQGQKLQDILPHCKAGDVLECVQCVTSVFTVGEKYPVYNGIGNNFLRMGKSLLTTSEALFIKSGTNSEDVDKHDSWGIGKTYTAPKKEWQPDTLDVDLTKKIWEW